MMAWMRVCNIDDENKLENESKLDWWPKADVNRVSSSQEEYVDNQFLDVKYVNHSNLDNLEMRTSFKTNKSAWERKRGANDAYNKYYYKSNIMIDQIALNLYNNQVEKKKQESWFQQHRKKGNVGVELTLLEVIHNTSGKFYQVVNTKNMGAAIQYYFFRVRSKFIIDNFCSSL